MYAGAYVPLTEEGNILVDEVLASCHAAVDHDLGQLIMAPMQWFSETMQMVFGDDGGVPAFVKINDELGTWIYHMDCLSNILFSDQALC